MQLLYKSYACEKMDEEGNVLLPGYAAQPDMRRLQPGEKIQVELADGTFLQTVVVSTQFMTFSESAQSKFLRAAPGFYCAVKVPSDFDAPGIELGANVYADDLPTSAA